MSNLPSRARYQGVGPRSPRELRAAAAPLRSGLVTDLPVEDVIPELIAALAARRRAVLVAPPGSGKTTVVPLRLLPEITGKIVVLEPRRLATRAAARRMAFLLGESVGETVGYVTRDDRKRGPRTRIEVVTEGVLTRRLQRRPDLPGTGLVVFDEVHERNLQTDLGLALALDCARSLRPDLAIVVMSATIDTDRLAALLAEDGEAAPVVVSESRAHSVEIRWAPPPRQGRLEDHAVRVIRKALTEEDGDVLVFLPGMAEMRRVATGLEGIDATVHLLHGSLAAGAQDAALAPSSGERKVVLSTDIAETSLTVEGVRVVIDAGLARTPRFDVRLGMTRLRTVPIARSSADQRAGRAGRTEPGVAYRLWSKVEHGTRKAHTDPEITQVDLAGLVLELACWGVTDPGALAFLDPPPARTVAEGRRLLEALGALDAAGRPTAVGKRMANLPLHPRLAHMVAVDGTSLACLLAALVEDRDVLAGRADELPADLGLRVRIVAGETHDSRARGVERVRASAADIARRADIPRAEVDAEAAGRVLALAFPDRLAIRRGGPGRFQLRTGATAWLRDDDPLAVESFLIAADLDGKRTNARIRLAAAIDPSDVAELFAAEVEEVAGLVWEGSRLVARSERRLGGIVLDLVDRAPPASPATTAAVLDKASRTGMIPWEGRGHRLLERVAFLHGLLGEPWPAWTEADLTATLGEWLVARPLVSLAEVESLDLESALRRHLGPLAADLDRLAPSHLIVPSGRRVPVEYGEGRPSIDVKVQEMYGSMVTPKIAGVPVVLRLLSPAGRPIQITSDLAGFWAGSWAAVRKDMAGRYPRHSWPADPGAPVG